MSPRANRDTDTAPVRYPRSMFEHAHIDGTATFPPTTNGVITETIHELPDNWNGTDKIILKYYALETSANSPFNIVLNAGQDGEVFNIHTQTLALHTIDFVANQYTYEDITALVAAFIALIAAGDIVWITSQDTWGLSVLHMGTELQET